MNLYSRPRAPRFCRDWSALPVVLMSSLTPESTVYDACCAYIRGKHVQALLRVNPRAAEPYLHIAGHIGTITLAEASSPRFSAVFRDERLGDLASGTVNGIISKMNKLFKALADYGVCGNPYASISRLKTEKKRPARCLTEEEIAHVLAYFDKHVPRSTYRRGTYGDIVRLSLQTAMRYEEILTLRNCDYDKENMLLHIPFSKNGEARDVVLMPADVAIIEKYLPADPLERLFPFSYGALVETLAYYNKKFGRDIRFHLFRHTSITHYAEQPGVTIHELKGFSGHRSTQAADRYLHAETPQNRQRVRERRASM